MDNSPLQNPMPSPTPQFDPAGQQPAPPPKKSRKKIIVGLAAVLALATAGGLLIAQLVRNDPASQNSSTDWQTQAEVKPGTAVMDSIKSQEDLNKLSEADQSRFCDEVLSFEEDSPEIKALHDRLGLDGGLYENLYLGCALGKEGDEYTTKDKSGQNDSYYRRNAAQDKAEAQKFTFTLYDTTHEPNDLKLSKRVALDDNNGKEARSLLMVYSTLVNGGYSPYSSVEKIRIAVFNPNDFPGFTSNCGPQFMTLAFATQHNNDACTRLSDTFEGQPIYQSGDASNKMLSVTMGTTRITVEARDQTEALQVMKAMKKSTLSQMDFFIKN